MAAKQNKTSCNTWYILLGLQVQNASWREPTLQRLRDVQLMLAMPRCDAHVRVFTAQVCSLICICYGNIAQTMLVNYDAIQHLLMCYKAHVVGCPHAFST
jgi:hypothetical protein